jgi:hypothetical protein
MKSKSEEVKKAIPKMPVMDEIENIGNSIMAKVEQRVDDNLRKNPAWTCMHMAAVLYHVGSGVLGPSDPDVQRLKIILTQQNEPAWQEVLNHSNELRKRTNVAAAPVGEPDF